MAERPEPITDTTPDTTTEVFVVGAHLRGGPLCRQLTDRGGVFVAEDRTAPEYRLVALPGDPAKPGLIRVGPGGGTVAGERWRLTISAFGSFVVEVPAPLAIGKVALADGTLVPGFVCEPWAAVDAPDITAYGGWKAYLAATDEP